MISIPLTYKNAAALTALALILLFVLMSTSAQALTHRNKGKYRTHDPLAHHSSFQGAIDELIDDDNDNYRGFQLSFSHFFTGSRALRLGLGVADRGTGFGETKVRSSSSSQE